MPRRLFPSINRAAWCALACSFVTPQWVCGQSPQQAVRGTSPVYVDLVQSRVYVLVGKTGFGHEHGVEGRLSGGHLALHAPQNAGRLEFDMTTFTADSAGARKYVGLSGETDTATATKVTANMHSADVLDVKRYPRAVFVVNSSLAAENRGQAGKALFVLDGEFTLHGVTRPLKVAAEAQALEGGARVRTRFAILQRDFGITPYTQLLGAVGVADRLDIWGDLILATQPPRTTRESTERLR